MKKNKKTSHTNPQAITFVVVKTPSIYSVPRSRQDRFVIGGLGNQQSWREEIEVPDEQSRRNLAIGHLPSNLPACGKAAYLPSKYRLVEKWGPSTKKTPLYSVAPATRGQHEASVVQGTTT